jgi:hypothetical protein
MSLTLEALGQVDSDQESLSLAVELLGYVGCGLAVCMWKVHSGASCSLSLRISQALLSWKEWSLQQ